MKQEKVQLLCDLSESKDDVARLEKVAEDLRKDSQSLATESELDIKGSKTQIEGLMRECESLRQEAALLSKECETCNRNLNAERSSRETAELTLKASQLEVSSAICSCTCSSMCSADKVHGLPGERVEEQARRGAGRSQP